MEYDSILNSKLAVKVLRELAVVDKIDLSQPDSIVTENTIEITDKLAVKQNNYSSDVARRLGKERASVSRIISNLKEAGLVEEGPRKQAQYYKIDYIGIGEFIVEKLESYAESNQPIERHGELFADLTNEKEELSFVDRDRLITLFGAFFIQYFSVGYTDSYPGDPTLENILFQMPLNSMKEGRMLEDFDDLTTSAKQFKSPIIELEVIMEGITGYEGLPKVFMSYCRKQFSID